MKYNCYIIYIMLNNNNQNKVQTFILLIYYGSLPTNLFLHLL